MNKLRTACAQISLSFQTGGDGRIMSSVMENEYIRELKILLPEITIAKLRSWYDFEIDGIYINLKLTNGGRDNAFNKTSLLFTHSGNIPTKKCMNMNLFWKLFKSEIGLTTRDPKTEYHYLVINKITNEFILKSILDISKFFPNPAGDNMIQINWNLEFMNEGYTCQDRVSKIKEILHVLQDACKKQILNKVQFAMATI